MRNRSIKNQITYLDKILKKGYDDKLQQRFPEGKVFCNAIFSLSILEFCATNNCNVEAYSKIVDANIERILSNEAKSNFNQNLLPKYGIFYNGWVNYVLYQYLQSELYKSSTIKDKIAETNKDIETRIQIVQTDSVRILDSYSGANWPADNLIGILSINNDSIKHKWIDRLFETAKHQSGLLHHAGHSTGEIRGSSQSMISYCLSKLDYRRKEEYNQKFKQLLTKEYIGVQMVQENEDGSNQMDFDSGPVILGYGASGTIMNIKTQASFNDDKSKKTWAAMNTISIPINIFGAKFYLLKKEPMFDIFMLWASVELQ